MGKVKSTGFPRKTDENVECIRTALKRNSKKSASRESTMPGIPQPTVWLV